MCVGLERCAVQLVGREGSLTLVNEGRLNKCVKRCQWEGKPDTEGVIEGRGRGAAQWWGWGDKCLASGYLVSINRMLIYAASPVAGSALTT